MSLLPQDLMSLIVTFASLFSQPVWDSALVLLVGAILAPGKRTVSAILRVMGLAQVAQFQKYHRVLNRAVWSARQGSQLLLQQLVEGFAAKGVLGMGIDDTLERRWGQRIRARGIYRDPVRSSDSHFVKTSGLRWLSLMLLVEIPWSHRVWALPFFTVLAPSERYNQRQGHRYKKLIDWGQMLTQVRRWLPERAMVLVADSSFAALEFLEALGQLPKPMFVVTRLRLDAALYEPAPPRQLKQMGRSRKVGKRLATLSTVLDDAQTHWQSMQLEGWYGGRSVDLEVASQTAVWYHTGLPAVPIRWVLVKDPVGREPQAFLCTDLTTTPEQILLWFRQRWQVEVTFEEARAHLGVETQRQWSDKAIGQTTPVLFALFSIVVLLAHQLQSQQGFTLPQSTWYKKSLPTFTDALALVRQRLWQTRLFPSSGATTDMVKIPKPLLDCWFNLLCYAV